MNLRFLGGDTGGGGSPRLYQDGDEFLVQGYAVTEPGLLAELNVPDGETVVRVPPSLWKYLPTKPLMSPLTKDEEKMFADCRHDACHLEMRDWYAMEGEDRQFANWQAGTFDLAEDEAARRPWLDLMKATTGRGVRVRRARIVSEPVTEYIRFEWAGTSLNIAAGEQVRWLPRRKASMLMLPGNDLWVIDGSRTLFNHFTGDGKWAGSEMIYDTALARRCSSAFDAVWAISAPHDQYDPG